MHLEKNLIFGDKYILSDNNLKCDDIAICFSNNIIFVEIQSWLVISILGIPYLK